MANRFRQFQHPDEHGRHELAVGHPVALDGVERSLGIELLHHHRGDAAGLNAHRPHRRRGVVERRRAQIHRLGIQPEPDQGRHHARRLVRRDVRQFAFDPLGPAGGARRVLQQVALDLVVDRRVRLIRNAFRVTLPARQVAFWTGRGQHQQLRQPARQVFGQARARVPQRRRPDDRLGAAVVDDVGRLGRGQVGVDRHVVQAAAPGRPHDRVDVLVVLHQDRDGVALAQTGLTEPMGQPVGAGLQVVEGDDGSRRVEDDSRFVGADIGANLHGLTVHPPNLTGVKRAAGSPPPMVSRAAPQRSCCRACPTSGNRSAPTGASRRSANWSGRVPLLSLSILLISSFCFFWSWVVKSLHCVSPPVLITDEAEHPLSRIPTAATAIAIARVYVTSLSAFQKEGSVSYL